MIKLTVEKHFQVSQIEKKKLEGNSVKAEYRAEFAQIAMNMQTLFRNSHFYPFLNLINLRCLKSCDLLRR